MIYFDERTRGGILERFHKHLTDNGHLFIGHSETLNQYAALFKHVQPAIYCKGGEVDAANQSFSR